MKRLLILLFITTCCVGPAMARKIEIVKSGEQKLSLDISGVSKTGGGNAAVFLKTLEDDLKRSGWFTVTAKGAVMVGGSLDESGGYLTMKALVSNRTSGRQYMSRSYNEKSLAARRMAHKVADDIVYAVKNVRGIAATSIVMIGARGGGQDLYLCDYDGANVRKITKEGAVCLAPSWGPEGKTIVYTSFLGGFPDVYRIDLDDSMDQMSIRKKRIVGFPGLNAGAEISPDGRSMVLILSKDGNPDLYIKDMRGDSLTRVTRSRYAAEASPSWSPDGGRIVYVSDKSRSPHLYVIGRNGGEEKKISFSGTENVSPDWGPDGRIAYSSKREGKFHVCVTNPSTGETIQLTSDFADYEDPSWAPDARHIVCSRTVDYNSQLYILDTLGDTPVTLFQLDGNWYSPSWSSK